MNAASIPNAPGELKLTPTLQEVVKTAFERGRPISVAYTDAQGHPQLSFRGSLQPYSDTALAIWVRNPESGILKAVRAGHEHIAALYGDPSGQRAFLTFRGRGRIDDSEAVRRRVYDSAPAGERDRDREQKGVPLIIELDSVEGLFQGEFLRMRR
ncbi:MAG TPA: hypothetical protein VHY19_01890 [Steroidobacteraceae bacterium]|jgi:hypothetical protein|nr:hypothetical protein [Steroidobacteraceae bacterium]